MALPFPSETAFTWRSVAPSGAQEGGVTWTVKLRRAPAAIVALPVGNVTQDWFSPAFWSVTPSCPFPLFATETVYVAEVPGSAAW